MDKSELRIRPGFLLGLFAIFAFFVCFGFFLFGVPTEKDKTHAKKIQTMMEERIMAEMLQENAFKHGGLTGVSKEFILDSLHAAGESQYAFSSRTDASSELIDIWQTPYRIELVGSTNFVIYSAGQNQKFGDADDIVFNSASNNFVKP